MKTVEQKAKAYDEVIGKLQSLINNANKQGHIIIRIEDIENSFPELKESEDGRIRKAIMEFLELQDDNTTYSFIPKKDILAWLEKQGSYTKKDVDDAYLKGISDAKNEIEKQYEASYQIRKNIATFIFNYRGDLKDRAKWMHYLGIRVSFFKNQDEKNPQPSLILKSALEAAKEEKVDNQNCVKPDKVEPRFHEGDFIVDPYCRGKIIALTSDAYLLDTGQGVPFSCEDNVRLWTIQDAKDGDVLASDNGVIILVKESRGSSWGHRLSYHCAVLYDGTFEHREFHVNPEKFFPATKEQRDLLFSKMKEARYEWDADKKKLKKIDDEEVKGEDYGIDGLWHAKRILEKTLGSVSGYQTDDGILDHKTAITAVKKLYEQKPTWTEEDGKKLSDILAILRCGENCFYNSPILIDWLKSLKERIGG